jgi:hypothetical protein
MNIMELGALGEFLGSIGVIVTLVYLATQIRQNTKVARADMSKDLMLTSRSAIWELTANPELAEIHSDVRGLGELESARRNSFLQSFYRLYEIAFTLHREGLVDDGIYQSYVEMIREYSRSKYFDAYWEQQGSFFPQDFREYVEEQRSIARPSD